MIVGHSPNKVPFPSETVTSARAIAEADHRIANSLSLLAALVHSEAAQTGDRRNAIAPAEAARMLREIGTRISTVAALHRRLARTAAPAIEFRDLLSEVVEKTMEALAPDGRFELDLQIGGPFELSSEQALPLMLIVTELINNSLKYAHPAGVKGNLLVACGGRDDGTVAVSVTDDGVGLPEGFDPETEGGLGFQTIRSLAEQIGAKLTFASGPLGLTVKLLLKPEKVSAAA
jgi:two-component sensor histidine kinase